MANFTFTKVGIMKLKYSMSLSLTLLFLSVTTKSFASEYWVKVEAEATGPYTVDATINSNIPGDIALAVDLSLKGLQPDEVAIGTGFTSVPFSGQPVTVVIDGEKKVTPINSKLPSGDYDVNVSFYPRWTENRATAESLNIEDTVEASTTVTLTASGEDSTKAIAKQEGQRWVMMNIGGDHPWDRSALVNRYGEPEYIEHTSLNPRIMKNYYFKSIDMTFIVNIDKGRILTWRLGRVSQ